MDPQATLCAGLTFFIVFLGVLELGLPWIRNAPIGEVARAKRVA